MRTLFKYIKEVCKYKQSPCSKMGRLILLRWQYFPIRFIDSVWFLSKFQSLSTLTTSLRKTDNLNLKFIGNPMTQNRQNNLEKQERIWFVHTFWFQNLQLSYIDQNTVVLAWGQTHRSIQQNRESGNNLHIYGQLIFEKTVKNIVEKTVFSTNGSRINWICACNTNNLDHYLIPHMKMRLKNRSKT